MKAIITNVSTHVKDFIGKKNIETWSNLNKSYLDFKIISVNIIKNIFCILLN